MSRVHTGAYLSSFVVSRRSAGFVALCPVIIDGSRLFSVGAGASARPLLSCLTRRDIRILGEPTNKMS